MSLLRGVRLLGFVTVALVAQACATPPQKEMQQARSAIEAARAAGAEQYAPDGFAAAAAALRRSEEAAGQRDYRLALTQALDAAEHAGDAARTAAAEQAAARAAADGHVRDLAASADRARLAIAAAEAARPSRAVRLAISDLRRAIVVANVALQKAREALGQQDYRTAVAACEGAATQLDAAIRALSAPAAPSPARRHD